MIYTISDERDVVRLRTNFRHGEDVYLFHTPATPEQSRIIRNLLFDTTTALLYAHLARSRRCGTIFIWSALNRYAFCTSLAEIALLMALDGLTALAALGKDTDADDVAQSEADRVAMEAEELLKGIAGKHKIHKINVTIQGGPPDRLPDEPERKAAYAFISGSSKDKDSLAVETVKTFLVRAGFVVEQFSDRELRIRHGAKKTEA